MKKGIFAAAAVSVVLLSANAFASESTTVEHGKGEKSVVTSDHNGSTIDRNGTREHTRETNKEAVDRVVKESGDRGEKATVVKK